MYLLSVCIFLFCSFLIFTWAMDTLVAARPQLLSGGPTKEGLSGGPTKEGLSGPTKEGLSGQSVKYCPDPKVPNLHIEFSVGDLADETAAIYQFVKLDQKMVDTSGGAAPADTAAGGEYRQALTDMAIYKAYTPIANGYDKYMDKTVGMHFLSEDLAKKKDPEIRALLRADLAFEDLVYSRVLYCCGFSAKYAPAPVSDYFGDLVVKYKTTRTQLDAVRRGYYAFAKPVALMRALADDYAANATRYKNADGPTAPNDSAIYFLNTARDLLINAKPSDERDLHFSREDAMFILDGDEANKADARFPLDSLRIFYCAAFFYRLSLMGDLFNIDKSRFVAGFPEYLRKKSANPDIKSVVKFLCEHPPAQFPATAPPK